KEKEFDRFRKGDREALKMLFDLTYEPLVRYAHSFTTDKDIAKDIAQSCLIKLWENRAAINYATFQSYLFVSAKNSALNYLRDQKKWKQLESSIEFALTVAPPNDVVDRQKLISSLIESGVQKLPAKCRAIFLLAKQQGLSYQEISEELGISVKTVERQMGIALSKLKAYILPFRHLLTE
ncbi:MAG: RNA polymerase sigma-70 factor, partial [Bacteroidota bacterium]